MFDNRNSDADREAPKAAEPQKPAPETPTRQYRFDDWAAI